MYGRLSSSFALLMSAVVIGISAVCGICILSIQYITLFDSSFHLIQFITYLVQCNIR